jgi:energy-coupling factor transporter ATP-binding protein EcfA2
MNNQNKEAEILYLNDVKPVKVKWLAPMIPLGKLVLCIGDPGIGKSTLAVYIAAMLSAGKPIFDDESEPLQGKTIFLSGEDNVADTLKPRLLSAGADCSQVAVIKNMNNDLSADCQLLENAIKQTGAKLVVLDPLSAYIGRDADMCRAADMRRMMGGLAVIAEKYECAFLNISHLNKAAGTKSLYRGLGSIDIAASARSVMLVERAEDDPAIRLIHHIKSSLAPENPTLAFQIGAGSAIEFLGEYDGDATDGHDEPTDGKRELATNVILGLLSEGAMPSATIQDACAEVGISESTIKRAKKDLGIRSVRKNDVWHWSLD